MQIESGPFTTVLEKELKKSTKVSYDDESLAIVEVDDLSLPFLTLEVLTRDYGFTRIFEANLTDQSRVSDLHLPIVLRLSMKGQPVAE